MNSIINFKRIIEEAYESGVTELNWELDNRKFKTIRYENAILFLFKKKLIGSYYTDDKNYSTRKFTTTITFKMAFTPGIKLVKVEYVNNEKLIYSFNFNGCVPDVGGIYIQSMFRPIKKEVLGLLKEKK